MIPARKSPTTEPVMHEAKPEIDMTLQEISKDARHEGVPIRRRKIEKKQRVEPNSTTGGVAVISKERKSRRAAKKIPDQAGGYLADCENLSKMELRRRYSPEANSHRNMLARVKSHGAVVHPDFRDFASFLRHVGPKPANRATLDRIDNNDPEYAPGKVRWADKRTQNNNKSDTLIFYYSRTGDTYTVSRLAKLRGVSPSTIRKHRERGWSDDEIIEGKRRRTVVGRNVDLAAERNAAMPRTPMTGRELELELLRKRENASSAKDKAYWDMALSYEQHRRIDGEEAFPAPLEVLNEGIADLGLSITSEQYERKIRKWWPEHRPHVDFGRLPLSQKKLIAVIDPEYVAKWEAREQRRSNFAEQL